MQIRLFKPSLGEEEINAIRKVFDRAWIGLGPKVNKFEKKWTKFIGCRDSVAVNSGTAALHLALSAYKFPRGKKVLVPALTFISTATAALYNQLEPVFVDVDEETLSIDIGDLTRKVDKDCVAVVPVHFGGHPARMDAILKFAHSRNLKVIEDCAHSQGGQYMGKKLGTWGDIGCFSFEEKKGMTTGDGGMICINDVKLNKQLFQALRWVGIDKDTWKRHSAYTSEKEGAKHWYYEISELGYKYNMNDLAATIGLAQLKKLASFNLAKCRAIKHYLDQLSDIKECKPLLPYNLNSGSSYWLFGLRVEARDALMRHLKEKGIATGVHYTPLPMQPLFSGHKEPIPVARSVYSKIISLPLFPGITKTQIDYVANTIRRFYSSLSKRVHFR